MVFLFSHCISVLIRTRIYEEYSTLQSLIGETLKLSYYA